MLHLSPASTVVIIGPPGSGKTTVGLLLAESSGLPLYSTDNYLGAGHVAALYAVMQAIGDDGWIVEGMIGYRMLRKRRQLRMPPPDIVVQLEASDEQIAAACKARGKDFNLGRMKAFIKAHDTVLEEYYSLDGAPPHIWIHADSPHVAHLIGGGPAGTANSDSST